MLWIARSAPRYPDLPATCGPSSGRRDERCRAARIDLVLKIVASALLPELGRGADRRRRSARAELPKADLLTGKALL